MAVDSILCADWSAEPNKRSLYVAHVKARVIRRVEGGTWDVRSVLAEAARCARAGSVLLSFDVPVGIPKTYLTALQLCSTACLDNFLQFLSWSSTTADFFEPLHDQPWNPGRPFFAVESGEGGLSRQFAAMRLHNVEPLRLIEQRTRGKSVFIKSGIPGSVGSAACDIWRTLGSMLNEDRGFRLWPFEGELTQLLSQAIVVAENYPRAAYATALLEGDSTTRPPLSLAKTRSEVRNDAIDRLCQTSWVQEWNVKLDNLTDARWNEDDFDACMTAAALLRCVLADLDLHDHSIDRIAEGGILGTGSINLDLPEQQGFSLEPLVIAARSRRRSLESMSTASRALAIACPIPGCSKVFENGRGGWDRHIEVCTVHPNWHPQLRDKGLRKAQFRLEFPEFF